MLTVEDLPTLNASLNATSAVLLTAGYVFIRRKERQRHKVCMLTAFAISVLFLISYVIYHAQIGSRPFPGEGVIRAIYFSILIPHVILAATIVPLAVITLSRGLSNRIDTHRRIARWTLPIWLFVSVTGVIVYLMLYKLY
ncbi:MAG: DUF420 domain-containing protein [Vicinamibacterales bacterium]